MISEPKVSIISPCYNGEKYVERFLASVLMQTYSNIELIMVDDGSIDRSKEIILSYKELFEKKGYQLNYIYQQNKGQAAAINQGLKVFAGDFLMWVDCDDILYPQNVDKKIQFLQNNPECGFVQCLAEEVKDSAPNTRVRIMGRKKPLGKDALFEDLIYERNMCFGPGVIMVRRKTLIAAIPTCHIFESREGQNWQLMLPLAYASRCGYLDEILCKIVAHDDSHSRTLRTYEQKILRYKGFEEILLHTIQNIEGMPLEEKNMWVCKATEKCQRKILREALANHDRNEVLRASSILSTLGVSPTREKNKYYLEKIHNLRYVPNKVLRKIIGAQRYSRIKQFLKQKDI